MRRERIYFAYLLLMAISIFTGCSSTADNIGVVIETSEGVIKVELAADRAPKTVANFLRYVDAELYNNSSFIRTCTPENEADRDVKIVVIQSDTLSEDRCFAPIEIETTEQTGILHTDGVLSMARSEPNSATASYFITIGDQPSLDYKGARNPDGYGFAAFGRVTEGMDVVREINRAEEIGQYIVEPIEIIRVYRE